MTHFSVLTSCSEEETKRLTEKEASIAAALDEIQKMLRVSQTLPEEASAFGSISKNLKHKERELNANENTMEYLSQGNYVTPTLTSLMKLSQIS